MSKADCDAERANMGAGRAQIVTLHLLLPGTLLGAALLQVVRGCQQGGSCCGAHGAAGQHGGRCSLVSLGPSV